MQYGTVVQVTEGGRGFVIGIDDGQYVVTAAHCLPDVPPAHAASDTDERTFANVLGSLKGSCGVWAECAFVDPVADLAVLQEPDGQVLFDEHTAYETLTSEATPFRLGKPLLRRPRHRLSSGEHIWGRPEATVDALMLSLEGEWFSCRVKCFERTLWIESAEQDIRGGMSGSPIILPDGSVIGVVCVSTLGSREGGPNPVLASRLPAWLVRKLAAPAAA